MVVRFITRRYIGDYDPTLEKIYTFHTVIDNEMICFDILDTAGQPDVSIYLYCIPRTQVVVFGISNIRMLLYKAYVRVVE